MSLLLLFTSNQPFSEDIGREPIIGMIIDNTPSLSVIGVFEEPILALIDVTRSVFTDTSTTYSQSDVEYSSSDQLYGGSDRASSSPPTIYSVGNL